MTLLITIIAAVAATLVWYNSEKARELKIGVLCWMFWGASLMWMGDAIFGYIEDKAAFFAPSGADMINDGFLGFSVIALALIIWVVVILISDPKGTVKAKLIRR
jgi:multisubunit Na+/H+ antiporter MnhB subunit